MSPFKRREFRNLLIRLNGAVCFYCKRELKRIGVFKSQHRDDDLTIDHIVPISKGGKWEIGNLVLACYRCNVTKGNKTT